MFEVFRVVQELVMTSIMYELKEIRLKRYQLLILQLLIIII